MIVLIFLYEKEIYDFSKIYWNDSELRSGVFCAGSLREPEQNHHSKQGFAKQNRCCNPSLLRFTPGLRPSAKRPITTFGQGSTRNGGAQLLSSKVASLPENFGIVR